MQWQIEVLRPYFDQVRKSAGCGAPGMLVAQLSEGPEGTYVMVPAFLDHDLATMITEKGRDIPAVETQ